MATQKEKSEIKQLISTMNTFIEAQAKNSTNGGISPQLEEDIRSIKQDMTNILLS